MGCNQSSVAPRGLANIDLLQQHTDLTKAKSTTSQRVLAWYDAYLEEFAIQSLEDILQNVQYSRPNGEITFGRSPRSEITLYDSSVCSKHCTVQDRGGSLSLTNLSDNGTGVLKTNGQIDRLSMCMCSESTVLPLSGALCLGRMCVSFFAPNLNAAGVALKCVQGKLKGQRWFLPQDLGGNDFSIGSSATSHIQVTFNAS
jgi:hypothetical protein